MTPPLVRDHVPSDPEQPRHRLTPAAPEGPSRLDHRDEHISRQIGSEIRIVHATRDETLHRLDVLAIEALERHRIRLDLGQLVHPTSSDPR